MFPEIFSPVKNGKSSPVFRISGFGERKDEVKRQTKCCLVLLKSTLKSVFCWLMLTSISTIDNWLNSSHCITEPITWQCKTNSDFLALSCSRKAAAAFARLTFWLVHFLICVYVTGQWKKSILAKYTRERIASLLHRSNHLFPHKGCNCFFTVIRYNIKRSWRKYIKMGKLPHFSEWCPVPLQNINQESCGNFYLTVKKNLSFIFAVRMFILSKDNGLLQKPQ